MHIGSQRRGSSTQSPCKTILFIFVSAFSKGQHTSCPIHLSSELLLTRAVYADHVQPRPGARRINVGLAGGLTAPGGPAVCTVLACPEAPHRRTRGLAAAAPVRPAGRGRRGEPCKGYGHWSPRIPPAEAAPGGASARTGEAPSDGGLKSASTRHPLVRSRSLIK